MNLNKNLLVPVQMITTDEKHVHHSPIHVVTNLVVSSVEMDSHNEMDHKVKRATLNGISFGSGARKEVNGCCFSKSSRLG